MKCAVTNVKASGSIRVMANLIVELAEPLQGLLVHAYRAHPRRVYVPESWHEATIWVMPKGSTTRGWDPYWPFALRQQDMRMLTTPLMHPFRAVLAWR